MMMLLWIVQKCEYSIWIIERFVLLTQIDSDMTSLMTSFWKGSSAGCCPRTNKNLTRSGGPQINRLKCEWALITIQGSGARLIHQGHHDLHHKMNNIFVRIIISEPRPLPLNVISTRYVSWWARLHNVIRPYSDFAQNSANIRKLFYMNGPEDFWQLLANISPTDK